MLVCHGFTAAAANVTAATAATAVAAATATTTTAATATASVTSANVTTTSDAKPATATSSTAAPSRSGGGGGGGGNHGSGGVTDSAHGSKSGGGVALNFDFYRVCMTLSYGIVMLKPGTSTEAILEFNRAFNLRNPWKTMQAYPRFRGKCSAMNTSYRHHPHANAHANAVDNAHANAHVRTHARTLTRPPHTPSVPRRGQLLAACSLVLRTPCTLAACSDRRALLVHTPVVVRRTPRLHACMQAPPSAACSCGMSRVSVAASSKVTAGRGMFSWLRMRHHTAARWGVRAAKQTESPQPPLSTRRPGVRHAATDARGGVTGNVTRDPAQASVGNGASPSPSASASAARAARASGEEEGERGSGKMTEEGKASDEDGAGGAAGDANVDFCKAKHTDKRRIADCIKDLTFDTKLNEYNKKSVAYAGVNKMEGVDAYSTKEEALYALNKDNMERMALFINTSNLVNGSLFSSFDLNAAATDAEVQASQRREQQTRNARVACTPGSHTCF